MVINRGEDDKIAIASQELEKLLLQIMYLIDDLQRGFDQFSLEEYFLYFKDLLEQFKINFEKIRDDTFQVIDHKTFMKFRQGEAQLEAFINDFRQDDEIADVMSYLSEPYRLNEEDNDTNSWMKESELTSNNETGASEDNLNSSSNPTINTEEANKAVDIVGVQSVNDLRSKYFPKEDPSEYLSELSLNLSQQDDVDFMKEFVKKKQAIDVEKYTIKLPENFDDERLASDFIGTGVNPTVCKKTELVNTLQYDFLGFSQYERGISKIMKEGDFRLNLKNFELNESTFKNFATKVEAKNILIDLDDCWLKYGINRKHEK